MSTVIINTASTGDILIVDDTQSDLKLFSDILRKVGYTVRSTTDGELALRSVQARLPDLILLDIAMPDLDGYEVCRRLKDSKDTRDIPVIFISVRTSPLDKVKAFATGGVDYISKPFEPEEVLARVSMHLTLRKTQKKIEEKNLQLQQEITERKEMEERIKRLNLVLRAIRNVNQLITKVKDRDKLLQGACNNLIETRGYYNAWIALLDKSGKLLRTGEAGLGEDFLPMLEYLKRGELTDCGRTALLQSDVVLTEDPSTTCRDCPIKEKYSGRGAMTVRLEYEEKVYGLLCVSIPKDFVAYKEEQDLFREVVKDIAFALYNIEQEDKRKQVEEALRVTSERLELAMDAGEHGFWDWNIDTNEVFFSPRYYTMLGYENKELPMVLDTWINLMHPEDRETIVPEVQKYAENAEPYEIEFRLKCKDGSWKWISGRGKSFELDENGVSHRAVGLHVDITKRKRADELLQKSEEKYRLLAENASDVIWTRDMNLNLTYLSPSIEELTGYSVEESMALPNSERMTPASMELMANIFEEELKLEAQGDADPSRALTIEIEMICKDGSTVWVEVAVKFIRNQTGQAVGILGISRDINERKQAEEEKKKLEAQLRQAQKMETIGALAGGIAHDFNNTLFSIIGYTDLTMDDVPEGSLAQSNLKEVLIAANRAKEMIQQILTFSRQTETEKRPVMVQSVVKETIELLKISIPTTIEIRQNIDANCKPVMADPTQIHQVVMNLATNAYHAMREKGGVLAIDVAEEEISMDDSASYTDFHSGTYIKLTVSDTGHGMDKAVMEKIFDPYFTTKPVGQGTGMGLSTIHGIVKSHGGDIKVYSEPGKGTVFHVYFPLIETKPVEPEIVSTGPVQKGSKRILLVDDQEPIVSMVQQTLERLGYQVAIRTSSLDALEAFRAAPDKFDLVITDMTMPNMTGVELAPRLLEIRPDIPIILCTGFSEITDANKAKALGIREFLMKPIVRDQIAGTIRKVLDKGKEK